MRKGNEDLYNPLYLSYKVREADDKKYLLIKGLYELSTISYEKGSRPGDYIIRDGVSRIKEALIGYYDTLKMFDNGKNGDLKAFEDIIVFFENSFIDSYLLGDRLIALKAEITGQKEDDRRHNEKHAGTSMERKKNIYIVELENRIKSLELRFSTELSPRLREFLNNVNCIVLFEKIKSILEQSKKSINTAATNNNLVYFKNSLITYLYLYYKINPGASTMKQRHVFIEETLADMGFNASLEKYLIADPKIMKRLLDEINDEFDILVSHNTFNQERIEPNFNLLRNQGESASNSGTVANDRTKILKFLKKLCRVDVYGLSAMQAPNSDGENLNVEKVNRHLFHTPGSFGVSLKTTSDYLINSLIFIGTWLLREIEHNGIPIKNLQPILSSLVNAEDFVHAYEKAILISSRPGNRSESSLSGEVHQYISEPDALHLSYLIHRTCDEMNESFSESLVSAMEHPVHGLESLWKRVKISQEAFIEAKIKIERSRK